MFVVTPYIPGQDGIVQPKMPNVGPCRDLDKRPCKICTDHDRERKTGPRFLLRVVRCRTHNKSFTLYPPGYVPYGRKLVGNLGEDGNPIVGLTDAERFSGTIFDAALDADKQLFWPFDDGNFHVKQSAMTQANHLNLSKELLGIKQNLSIDQRFIISHIIRVPITCLLDAANRTKDKVDFQTQGKAIREILEKIPPFYSSAFERFVAVGTYLGRWALLHVWDPVRQRLNPSKEALFYALGTRAPPG